MGGRRSCGKCGVWCGNFPHHTPHSFIYLVYSKLYFAILLYKVFLSTPSSVAAFVLLLPACCNASIICFFSLSPLCNCKLGLLSLGISNSFAVMNLFCASSVARFTMFFNWRRFQGQWYSCISWLASLSKPTTFRSSSLFAASRKWLANSRISSLRSLSDGICSVNSLRRW